jgi:hypothetical protein
MPSWALPGTTPTCWMAEKVGAAARDLVVGPGRHRRRPGLISSPALGPVDDVTSQGVGRPAASSGPSGENQRLRCRSITQTAGMPPAAPPVQGWVMTARAVAEIPLILLGPGMRMTAGPRPAASSAKSWGITYGPVGCSCWWPSGHSQRPAGASVAAIPPSAALPSGRAVCGGQGHGGRRMGFRSIVAEPCFRAAKRTGGGEESCDEVPRLQTKGSGGQRRRTSRRPPARGRNTLET